MSFSVSKGIPFSQCNVPQNDHNLSMAVDLPALGGNFVDTRYFWHSKGPCLEVRNTKSGSKVGAWTFGSVLRDSTTKIVCVAEILRPNGWLSLLAVGIECTVSGGLVCLFDIFNSRVIRVIQVKEKISHIHVIDPGLEVLNLPGPLRNFDGILAVGSKGGNVFLVDICRQICEESLNSSTIRDELSPCQLLVLTSKNIHQIEYYKERSVREGDHLAIHLNAIIDSQTEHFTLKGPKSEDILHVNKEEVAVSALYYCAQLTSLLVGFNFGAFQLWNLTNLQLIYTSPVCDEHLPITQFILQEPTDDPRAFCYIWVSYSNTELFQSGLPFAVMYSLCYESKDYHQGYGYLYQDFQYCAVRFQMELGQLEKTKEVVPKGGYCLGLQSVCKHPYNDKESHSQYTTGDTLALCVISWTIWFGDRETQTNTLIFDLNQWYKEQMPNFRKWTDCTNYILPVNLNELPAPNGSNSPLVLNVVMDIKSLSQFIGVQRLEEHFYPTSLTFDLWMLREEDIILVHCEGLQNLLLFQIEAAGPLCLLRPNDMCRQIVKLGLLPLFVDFHIISSTIESERETILNVGLEHQLLSWLCKCASEWANGKFISAGCSLDFLIKWAFQRAIILKTNCDKYCSPLFDYSQSRLDSNTSVLLNSSTRQITDLCGFYSYIIKKQIQFISCVELAVEQHTSLEMVSIYFEVLQWLVNVGLLPECHPSSYPRPDNIERISAPYPVQELTKYYDQKRANLQRLSQGRFTSSDTLLFIDNLINNQCGAEHLQQQWQEDGGSGLYPPPSIQSMLRTYLVPGASICHKHSLVIYLFLDLATALDQSQYSAIVTHLIKFPAVFKVSSSVIKITQAFWQLDHGDYTTAMEQLLDPFVINEDLQPWHHTIAMRSLLLQNQFNFALLYMQVRKPPITDEQDILTAISLFIANNMLDEAFYFKKQHQSGNEEKLLVHLFNECNKNESIHDLLYRSLSSSEEKAFLKYLKSTANPSSNDLQVFYYLLRSRFIEAFDMHSNVDKRNPDSQGLIGQRRVTKTDQIVRIFKNLLPDVNRNLVDYVRRERTNLWKQVPKPTPLSVFVHNTKEQVHYKSTVIHAALAKAKHTFNDTIDNSKFNELITEDTPFLRTPTVYRMYPRNITPTINPTMIELNEDGEEVGPPSKRLKLSQNSSKYFTSRGNTSAHYEMLTPIVKRKTSLQRDQTNLTPSRLDVCTPQSILKVRAFVKLDNSLLNNTFEEEPQRSGETSPRKTGLGLLPRKSLSRSPRRSHVQFDGLSSLSDQSLQLSNITSDNLNQKSTLSTTDISLMITSKNSSSTSNVDDVFYSPNTSADALPTGLTEHEVATAPAEDKLSSVSLIPDIEIVPTERDVPDILLNARKEEERILTEIEFSSHSPKSRRSYKRSLREMSPIRASPRLAARISEPIIVSETIEEDLSLVSELKDEVGPPIDAIVSKSDPIPTMSFNESPRMFHKVQGRRSLSRQVLENNTFSKILQDACKNSEENAFLRTEKSTIADKSINVSHFSTTETSIKIVETSFHDRESSLANKAYSSGFLTDIDTSFESSDLSLELEPRGLEPDLTLSDSLAEYMEYRKALNNENKQQPKVVNTPDLLTDCTIQKSDTTVASSTASTNEKKMSEVYDDLKNEERKLQSQTVNTPEIFSVETSDTPTESNKVSIETREGFMSEVYEDLSSGTEDIAEVLRESRKGKIEVEAMVDLDNCFNQLEDQIFELPGKTDPFNISYTDSDNFHISESDVGFIVDESFEDSPSSSRKPAPKSVQESVIVISSEEEDNNESDNLESTSDGKSEAADDLNMSFERHVKYSESSASTDSDSLSSSSQSSETNIEAVQLEVQNSFIEIRKDNSSVDCKIGSGTEDDLQETDTNGFEEDNENLQEVTVPTSEKHRRAAVTMLPSKTDENLPQGIIYESQKNDDLPEGKPSMNIPGLTENSPDLDGSDQASREEIERACRAEVQTGGGEIKELLRVNITNQDYSMLDEMNEMETNTKPETPLEHTMEVSPPGAQVSILKAEKYVNTTCPPKKEDSSQKHILEDTNNETLNIPPTLEVIEENILKKDQTDNTIVDFDTNESIPTGQSAVARFHELFNTDPTTITNIKSLDMDLFKEIIVNSQIIIDQNYMKLDDKVETNTKPEIPPEQLVGASPHILKVGKCVNTTVCPSKEDSGQKHILENTTTNTLDIIPAVEVIEPNILMKDQSVNTTVHLDTNECSRREELAIEHSKGSSNTDMATNTDTKSLDLDAGIDKGQNALIELNELNKSVPREELLKDEQSTHIDSQKGKEMLSRTTDLENSSIDIERPDRRKVYHPRTGATKITLEDPTTSSSDNTEGELLKQEIVVTAQIHVPSRKIDRPVVRRTTRNSSSSVGAESQLDETDCRPSTTVDKVDIDLPDSAVKASNQEAAEQLPISSSAGKLRESITATLKAKRISKTRRASDFDIVTNPDNIDCKPITSTEIIENPKLVVALGKKRQRSASVDELKTYSRKHSLRSNSSADESLDDYGEEKPKLRSRASSVSQLPVISEDQAERKTRGRSRAGNAVETYTMSRRLTRRQASMVKDLSVDFRAETPSEVRTPLEIDIVLLDHELSKGKPDPDEEFVFNRLSPSNSRTSPVSKPSRRLNRSTSAASDTSVPLSASQSSTPKRKIKERKISTDSISPGVVTRSRRNSDQNSVASEHSEPHTPPKRPRTRQSDADEVSSTVSSSSRTSLRSTTKSITPTKSADTHSPKRSARARRVISSKSNLPQISEEKVPDSVDVEEKPTTKRQTRKKSSQ